MFEGAGRVSGRLQAFTPSYEGSTHFLQSGLLRYHNIRQKIHQTGLKSMQEKHFRVQTERPKAAFDVENKIIESLFIEGADQDPHKKKLFDFCQILQKNAVDNLSRIILKKDAADPIEANKGEIAQIFFLADENIEETAGLVDLTDVNGSLLRLNKEFENRIQAILENLDQIRRTHNDFDLQDGNAAFSKHKQAAIARVLVTRAGLINIGLIDSVISHFFSQKIDGLICEEEIINNLNELKDSVDIQEMLSNVKFNADCCQEGTISNMLARFTLNLQRDTPMNKTTLIATVLAGFIGDMRQHDVSFCFTTVGTLMKRNLRKLVLQYLIQIIETNKLTVPANNTVKELIPILNLNERDLHETVVIDQRGSIVGKGSSIWQAPGVKAAIGELTNSDTRHVQEVIEAAVKDLCSHSENKEEGFRTTPAHFLKKIAYYGMYGCVDSEKELETKKQFADLKIKMLYRFCAETHNPMLSAMDTCLAAISMMNSKEVKELSERNLASTCRALEMRSQDPTVDPIITETASKCQKSIHKVMEDNSFYMYWIRDKYKEGREKMVKGQSQFEGAFQLSALKKGEFFQSLNPIRKPGAYRKFVVNCLKAARENGQNQIEDEEQKDAYMKTMGFFINYTSVPNKTNSRFINDAFKFYDERNANKINPWKYWREVEHLPFRDFDDNGVLAEEANEQDLDKSVEFKPKNAKDFLLKFLEQSCQSNFPKNGPLELDVDTPTHAFTWIPNEIGEAKADDYVKQTLTIPGKEIAQEKIDAETKKKIIEACCSCILPEEYTSQFRRQANNITQDNLTSYCQKIMKKLKNLYSNPSEVTGSWITQKFSYLVLNAVLSEKDRDALRENAIVIAKTNWVHGVRPLFLVGFFDIVSGKIQLGIREENTHEITPIDPAEWLDMPWDFYNKLTPTIAS